jgi:hypothetical protein
MTGISSLADKRYYHFVLAKTEATGLDACWRKLRALGDVLRPKAAVPLGAPGFALEHRKLKSEQAYARGEAAIILSEKGNGRPPFHYDIFAAKISLRSEDYVLLGFPFLSLAREAVDCLLREKFIQTKDFQVADIGELLKERNRPYKRFEGLSSRVVGIQFVVRDDKSLTGVSLGGDDPFHAQIYERFLKEKFEDGTWGVDLCVLACERESDAKKSGTQPASILHSRLRIDKWGNLKFYVHTGCSNVLLLPYAVGQIRAVLPFKQAFGNPLLRASYEE